MMHTMRTAINQQPTFGSLEAPPASD